jgi:hypothetical protein
VLFIPLDLNLSLSAKITSDFALDASACATGPFSIALDDSAYVLLVVPYHELWFFLLILV